MKQEKTLITVSNPQSPYFKEKGKLLSYLPMEKVEVFLIQTEIIVTLNLSDIVEPKSKGYNPKSRKDFYEYILNPKTSRVEITKTVEAMINKGDLVINSTYSKEALVTLLNDAERDKHQLVEDFRQLRDQQYIDFTLVNNHQSYGFKRN